MSQANDILENLTEEELGAYSAISEDEPHIVIYNDRTISVPTELKKIAVQFDHDIETVTFDCPRYWDEHDLSDMIIYINYTRADKKDGCYRAQNVTIDDTDEAIIHFTWTISRNVTEAFGMLEFSICAKKVDENGNEDNHWNSEINREMIISQGNPLLFIFLQVYCLSQPLCHPARVFQDHKNLWLLHQIR
jgi:hypothetical protein